MISKLERILNHHDKLHFNIPYDDVQAERWARSTAEKREMEWQDKFNELQNKFNNFFDIPIQVELGEKFPFSGYVDINGKIYKCESCQHESIIRQIVLNDYINEYLKVPATFYDHKPQGTFQEEYFAMKYLGFAKISSFENAPTKKILFRYNNLTWKQSDVIFPR